MNTENMYKLIQIWEKRAKKSHTKGLRAQETILQESLLTKSDIFKICAEELRLTMRGGK